ncbi:SDR family oxidoreductase [Streptomyces sp. NRRL S-87]|uniref:SDR family oxidoreductase n=1 Tax=Streptomyces sp. NRRL S-87 TaxID=1463920 RepID=UPI00099CBCA8|nr:SDR family oxidoreductase [Streptomyces sp. NRRL S-87]
MERTQPTDPAAEPPDPAAGPGRPHRPGAGSPAAGRAAGRTPAARTAGPALTGLPGPPPLGASALPPGTYEGRVVLVTGGGTGLGKAIAAEFARLGADLVIAGRRADRLAAARDELAAVGGGRVTAAVCDIRDPERIAEVFDAAEAASGRPDVLVNNAAANFPVPAEDMSPNAWRAVVDVTLTGTWFTSREFGRRHLSGGTPASIVNIGASYAWTGGPGFAHSAAAKAGVKSLVETLAVEWGPYGIQVNGLVPGLVPHPDMTPDIRSGLAAAGAAAAPDARQPALRVGAPRELGWAATFLASPYARFITGHTLVVDGANWQRRALVNPDVVPVRTQLGRGPFTP